MTPKAVVAVPVDVARLDEGLNRLEVVVGFPALELEWPGTGFDPIELRVDVARMGNDLQIDGHFRTRLHGICDRCLVEFDRELRGEFRALARRGNREAHELGDQDGVLFYDGPLLDLTSEVRDAILLQMPIQLICRDDCRGLCSVCGGQHTAAACDHAPRKVDPRWAALESARDIEPEK
jgi:uncharacterized protein